MALPLRNHVLVILVVALIPFMATSTSHHHHHPHLKSLHFSLFQHETINKTAYTIVNGVKVAPGVTPFGTLFVLQDPLTATANRSSKEVGIVEGTSITSSLDGLRGISVAKLTLRLKHHKGSISVVGVTNTYTPSDFPVVGGTGDFLFVQGYVTSSPVDLKGLTVVYKLQFHLYWPPYATQTS